MPGFWRKCRLTLRWLRFAVWGIALAVLLSLAWFHLIGLPGFLKTRLVHTLQQRGVKLEFSRLRLRYPRGLVAENVRLGQFQNPRQPVFTAGEVQLRLDYPALLHGRLLLDGLVLRNGTFTLPLSPSNSLALLNLQTELRFPTNEVWQLDHFQADFSGVHLSLAGAIAHPLELRDWPVFSGQKSATPDLAADSLQNFYTTLEKIHFTGRPQLNLRVDGDARDIHSFVVQLNADVPEARTPWFAARGLQLAASLTAPADAPTNFDAAWGFWTNVLPFRLTWVARVAALRGEPLPAETVECAGVWCAPELAVTRLGAQLSGGKIELSARLNMMTRTVTFTNFSRFDPRLVVALLPEKSRRQLASISWTQPPQIQVAGGLVLPAWTNAAWNWSADIAPSVRLAGGLAVTNAAAAGVPLDFVRTHFSGSNQVWRLPDLELASGRTRLNLAVEGGAVTKDFSVRISGALDAATVKPFLPTHRAVPAEFTRPLILTLAASGNWQNRDRLALAGCMAQTNFSVGGLPLDFARAQFSGSNGVWRLRDLEVAAGRTVLNLSGEADQATENFHCGISGTVDAASVKPFLTTSNALRGYQHLGFTEPLALQLDVTGNLRAFASLAATGHIALTNFAIRQQTVEEVSSDLSYSNLTVDFFHPQLARAGGTQKFAAQKLTLDLAGQKLLFTGGEGNVEAAVVARAIGPKTAKAMEPYQFLAIPQARVNGCIPLRHRADGELLTDEADLRFDVMGTTPFRWRKFETPAITGTIHWWKNFIILTNTESECYGGAARGWGVFDVSPDRAGTEFSFFVTGTNVDFHRMGTALWAPTNQLAGALAGTVTVTRANSEDWATWNGYGAMQLHDGLLWDVPVFGLISPVLNVVTPGLGLGNNRATDAAGRFIMTNGVIYTDSLDIHTLMLRVKYDGTVDLQQNVKARATAQFLRSTPLLGSMVSLLFSPVSKAFECEVTGTLGQPKVKPAHTIPGLLLVPLHPIRSVEDIFEPSPAPAEPVGK
jgi:hypothetical protein